MLATFAFEVRFRARARRHSHERVCRGDHTSPTIAHGAPCPTCQAVR